MGTYITQDSIDDIFGSANVTTWADLDNDGTADTDVVAAAIAYAEAHVEARFRPCGLYTIPFSPTNDVILCRWMAIIAGVELFQTRPNGGNDASVSWDEKKQQVEEEMDLYIGGSRRLTCARRYVAPNVPYVVR